MAACSLLGLPAVSGVCWAPPARWWGFTHMAQVAEAQLARGYPIQPLLPLGRQSASATPQQVHLPGWMYAAALPAEAGKESAI